jgi:phospholipase C
LIAQNGDADGEIYSVDYETGQQNDTYGKASLISTADDGEAWATQSGGQAMRWDPIVTEWAGNQGGFDQIAVSSKDLQWGLVPASSTNPQTLLQCQSPENTWTSVAASPEAIDIIQIATNSAGDLVCVTSDNKVFQYVAEGSTWVQLGGDDLAVQSISIRDPKNAWMIDTNGQAQALGPLLNPGDNPGQLRWDTESVWDETKSTHLYLVNRAAQLVATYAGNPAFQGFVQQQIQPGVGEADAGPFRQGLCQGLYDTDFLSAYNNPNFLGQATWKSHFYDESTGLNWMGETAPTALSNGVEFWQQSLTFLQGVDVELYKGGYSLGLALHYFTDLTQPMHAANYTYISSFPFGYHTDFEVYTMSQQALVQPQPTVIGFAPGAVNDISELYKDTAELFKQKYFPAIEQAHKYASWKWSPGQWQNTVLPLIPAILNDSVSATAQMLYLYIGQLVHNGSLEELEAVSAQS